MSLTKPQRRTNFFDYFPLSKKYKPSDEIQIQHPINYTRLENLPNELLLETFQYLDMYDIYKIFYNLNIRFQNLLYDSTFPWIINISLMTKSNFEQFNRQLLIPNRNRIQTLYISNPIFIDSIFSPVKITRNFSRLKTLIFNNVKPKYFGNILRYLTFSENLSRLTIISKDSLGNLFEFIFRLPKLKYLKLKSVSPILNSNISTGKLVTSSIEQIVLDVDVEFNAFISLPSYLPNLQTLYIQSLSQSYYGKPLAELYMEKWNNLKKIQIDKITINFNELEYISRQSLNQIEILRLTISINDDKYLNARRWEQLILNSMSKLRIFDIQYQVQLTAVDDEDSHTLYKTILDDFSSLFWIERKWFFDYQFYPNYYEDKVIFYSINSKRYKYVFYKESTKLLVNKHAKCIEIYDENVMLSCNHYFLHAIELVLSDKFSKSTEYLPNILESIMSLKQLTSLTITDGCNFSMKEIIYLLNAMPNINVLCFSWNFFKINDLMEIQQNEIFQNVAKTNRISHLIINNDDQLEILKIFIALCPQIKHLTMEIWRRVKCVENIEFLILNRQTMLPKLCLLHLKNVCHPIERHLETLVNTSDVFRDCHHKIVGTDFYICL